MEEVWKSIDWLHNVPPGILYISSLGRVRRQAHEYRAMGRWGKEHLTRKPECILAPWVARNGYLTISVSIGGKREKVLLHRLVAHAFVPGYEPGLHVNHINGVKHDNRPENLEWVTAARNTEHQWEIGLVDLRGDAHPSRKLDSGRVRIIRRLLGLGATSGELATLAGVSTSLIELIKQGRRWNSIG